MPIAPNLPHWVIVALPLVLIWDLAWRGVAMWRAARNDQTAWFVCLLVFNTAGVLPIIYLLLNRRAQNRGTPT